MKIKYATVSYALVFAVLISSVLATLPLSAAKSTDVGSITECALNAGENTLSITGNIKHSFLVNNRDGKIALYKIRPWEGITPALRNNKPIEEINMSIRYEFTVPCNSVTDKLSMYAVAVVGSNGKVTLITDPIYPDFFAANTSEAGFKGAAVDDVEDAIYSNASSAIVDVYLDYFDIGNQSGYLFSVDNEIFFFDREYVNILDQKIRSYYASGCDVFLRFLLSSDNSGALFGSARSSENSVGDLSVKDEKSLLTLYAYTYFLCSRYDGEDYGKISGIILGRSTDAKTDSRYNSSFAVGLCAVGLSALQASGNYSISLVVPFSDSVDPDGISVGRTFLETVAEYVEAHSSLSFTVMCESRHNPFGITDSIFDSDFDPDDTREDGEEMTESPNDDIPGDNISDNSEPVFDGFDDIEDSYAPLSNENNEEDNVSVEDVTVGTLPDRYITTEFIDSFLIMIDDFSSKYLSVNKGVAWCWYPEPNTSHNALEICYSYNFAKLVSIGADLFIIDFGNDEDASLSGISYLFKYIDTSNFLNVTSYARSFFEISDWSEMIDNFSADECCLSDLREGSFIDDVAGYLGIYNIYDYTAGGRVINWFAGKNCSALSLSDTQYGSALLARFEHDKDTVAFSDIGLICSNPEPLLYGDSLSFDIVCGENDNSIYVVEVRIYCEGFTIEANTVIDGGAHKTLVLDTAKFSNTTKVKSVKLCVKRLTGDGEFELALYKVSVNSNNYSNAALEKIISDAREEFMSNDDINSENTLAVYLTSAVFVTGISAILLIVAYRADKSSKNDN